MKILITTPFFRNLGGSELETIHTANAFASFEQVKEVHIYVYSEYNLNFVVNIFIHQKIKIIGRHSFFQNNFVNRFNKIIKKKLALQLLPLDVIYWRIKLLNNYDKVYIITKSTLNYYLPILKYFKNRKNIFIKYTTIFFQPMREGNLKYLSEVASNIVTSEKQAIFFMNELGLENVEVQDVLIFNEKYALNKKRNHLDKMLYDFGILGRFYEEKQLEHAIELIEDLNKKGIKVTLIIIGDGLEHYFQSLQQMIEIKKLDNLIKIVFESVSYNKVYDFFDRINCFLITSKYEGGPNIGLEVMAYGLPILSYDVGAMSDRLKCFPEFIAVNKEELIKKAIHILSYDEEMFKKKCAEIKKEYIDNYSNKFKLDYLNTFLNKK